MKPGSTSDDKARRILKAVRQVIIAKGYAGSTISEIAAAAGVSRGLLHYYFKNKEEMLARVIRQTVEDSLSLARALFERTRSAEDLSRDLTVALRQFLCADPYFYHLFFECWAIARQSALLEQELKTLYQAFRDTLAQGLDTAARRGALRTNMNPADLSILLTGLIDGMGLQFMSAPDLLDRDDLWRALETAVLRLLTA